jgi:Flp pilus assembly protein TadD
MRRVPTLLLSALLFRAPGALAAPPSPADALVEEGEKKLQADDVEGALAVFARAEKQAPRDPRPHYLRGAALAKRGDRAGAERAYREALAIDGKLAGVHNELGVLLEEQNKLDPAIAEFKAAVAADPKLAEGWANLGRAEVRKGDLAEAARLLKQGARELPKDADLRIDLSVALLQAKKLDEALAAAREAVALAPGAADAHLNLGLSLKEAAKLDAAQGELTAATRLAPQSATAWWALGEVERDRKKYDAALAALARAEQAKPLPAIVVAVASVYRARGDLARAEKVLRDGGVKHPRSLALKLELARALAEEKKCADAQQALAPLPPQHEDVRAAARDVAARCK